MMEKRYYLNNVTDSVITITLSTKRVINGKTSLPLNNKDVAMFKELKAKRAGRVSALDGLRLSTIRIEDSSNYTKADAKPATNEEIKEQLEAQANEALENNPDVKDFVEGKTDEVPPGTTQITEEEAARLELEAKAQLEAAAAEGNKEDAKEEVKEDTETVLAKEEDEGQVDQGPVEEQTKDKTKSNKKSGLFNFI